MSFTPVDASWMIEVGGESDTPTKYALVGWFEGGGTRLPEPVVAADNGIALLRIVAGDAPWKLRFATEEDW